jgi:hypothetical protein
LQVAVAQVHLVAVAQVVIEQAQAGKHQVAVVLLKLH